MRSLNGPWLIVTSNMKTFLTDDLDTFRSVKPLAVVQAFDPLCEVQSDKASVEITSPFEGVVKELLVKEGEVAKVGENLCIIEVIEEVTEGEETTASPPETSTEPIPPPAQAEVPKAAQPASEPPRRPHPLDPRAQASPHALNYEPAEVLALPSVRHFAKQNGVDLALLAPGSGRGGRIEKADVEALLARGSVQATAPSASSSKQPEDDVVVELNRTRHSMWKAMVKVSTLTLNSCAYIVTNIDKRTEPRDSSLRVSATVISTMLLSDLFHFD